MVLSCCSVIPLRCSYIHIFVSEHKNNIWMSVFLSFVFVCTGQPAAGHVPCTSCQDTLYPDSKSCPYSGNCSCNPQSWMNSKKGHIFVIAFPMVFQRAGSTVGN